MSKFIIPITDVTGGQLKTMISPSIDTVRVYEIRLAPHSFINIMTNGVYDANFNTVDCLYDLSISKKLTRNVFNSGDDIYTSGKSIIHNVRVCLSTVGPVLIYKLPQEVLNDIFRTAQLKYEYHKYDPSISPPAIVLGAILVCQ